MLKPAATKAAPSPFTAAFLPLLRLTNSIAINLQTPLSLALRRCLLASARRLPSLRGLRNKARSRRPIAAACALDLRLENLLRAAGGRESSAPADDELGGRIREIFLR